MERPISSVRFSRKVLVLKAPQLKDHLQGRRHGFESGGVKVIIGERSEPKKFFGLTPPLLSKWGGQIHN